MIRMLLWILLLVTTTAVAQEVEYVQYNPTAADEAYREFRMRKTRPPYGLDRINKLIKSIENNAFEEADAGVSALKPEQFKALSLREKFTYVMIHPEMYSQNCAIFIPQPHEDKKIFANLMSWMYEETWSERQINFLRENRDSVMSLIKESTLRSKHMGVNYKDAILEVNGWEMIPFLIEYFKSNKKDKDVLTVLNLLMKKGEYKEFLKSQSYRKLYGSDYNDESWINYNSANEKLVIDRAMGYFKEKTNK